MSLPVDQPELLRAQVMAFSRQVPLMYFILTVSVLGLAATHIGSAPAFLTLVIPSVVTVAAMLRLRMWWTLKDQEISHEQAVDTLKSTVRLAVVMSIGLVSWALALFPYGDAYEQTHVAFFIGITVIGVVFCLMHMRAAALLITVLVVTPFTAVLLMSGQMVYQAIAVNMVLVAGAMAVILVRHYKDFADLVMSKQQLLDKNEEAQRLGQDNAQLAHIDGLTQLANRRRFLSELEARLEAAGRGGKRLMVGILDLDGFKPINDAYGHTTGDRLLVEAGRRLMALATDNVFAARLGGDEFGIIVDAPADYAGIHAVGKKICSLLKEPYVLPGVTARVSASLGICLYKGGRELAEQLFERADYALHYAKQNLRGEPVVFSDHHESEIRELGRVDLALRRADLMRELNVAFQPIVDIETGRTVSFEALARWNSPDLGAVGPAVFIQAAERSGMIVRVTQVLLEKALATASTWPEQLRISFNLSARDIASMDTVRDIVEIVGESGVTPSRIDFELTETALVSDFDQARQALQALKDLGCRTALDDFGTGHSSLSVVRQLPLDRLKIDASFVSDLMTHQASRDIVQAVLDLCRSLRLQCVVEGVETAEQAETIRQMGAKLAQGYFYARPLAADAVAAHLTDQGIALLKTVAPQSPSTPRRASA
jgi:diguanylate cyclase (GGDEF)-like protein